MKLTGILLCSTSLVAAGLLLLARPYGHSSSLRRFPAVTLWAWERPEDLRFADANHYAVAYLAGTIAITSRVDVIPRRQPMLLAPGAKVIAVVRIEAHPGITDLSDPSLPRQIATSISALAAQRPTGAVQIDFDARQSQRPFYTALLSELRRALPRRMPLSITALASWCAYDDWIGKLPIDEAVPMFFRMGPEHPPAKVSGWSYPVREPLCRSAAGVSMDEPWPELGRGVRLYVFHPQAWNVVALENLEGDLQK